MARESSGTSTVVTIAAVAVVTAVLLTAGATAPLVAGVPTGPASSGPDPVVRAQSPTPAVDDVVGCPHGESVLEPAGGEPAAVAEPRIAALYPNPTTRGNVGEYVLLETPPDTRVGNWTLTDGYRTASFPNETVSGRIAASVDPDATEPLTDAPVVELEGAVRFAVDGDRLELRTETDDGTERLDGVSYDRAPTGDRWYRSNAETGSGANDGTPASGYWWPRDATCRPVATSDAEEATAFVLPDSPEVPLETIRSADDRLLLAGYTVTSDAVADELVAAADRGVDVAVLLESGPVGGAPAATGPVLERLEGAGIDVRAIGGEGARYRYHHPKYAVADDRLLVTTENWKPSGVGGESNRGWGIVLEDETLAAELATVFETDFEGWDTRTGTEFRSEASFVAEDGAPPQEFPAVHDSAAVEVESVELLVAPDNAERRLVELIDEADDELLVVQGSIDPDARVLEAAVDAARRGVDVRILLDSTWYREDENAALAEQLERTADGQELPLEVRLVEETDRFEKIHAKGVVIDREVAVVGSANWNNNSFRNNREVLVAAHGTEVAEFYAAVFEDDWTGDGWTLPLEFTGTVVLALVAAAIVGRRYVRFGDERPPGE